ncbi:MAG: hypothetical protein U9O98_01000 [Asgard group archaeon]|nr:hypothetical protein [Asgard group archaeon]
MKKSMSATKEEETVTYRLSDTKHKEIKRIKVDYQEQCSKKILNLQIIAVVLVLIITIVAPLRLFESQTIVDYTAIGFVTISLVPAFIAIFQLLSHHRLNLLLSFSIYFIWIIIQSIFYWEIILMMIILLMYYEITNTIQKVAKTVKDVESISESGTYYHANVLLKRYFMYLGRFVLLVTGISIMLGVLGNLVFNNLQGDIIFSIVIIISMIFLIIYAQKILTPDLEAILKEKQLKEIDKKMAEQYSKYS